jgi:tetratricopeptide (TPR) repeat protein
MKPWVCAAFMLGAMLGICRADAIHLKNGTTVSADKVMEKDGQLQYTVGGTQYSIPQSSVSSIDPGTAFSISIGTSKSGLIAPPAVPSSSLPANRADHLVSHTEIAAALPRAPQLHGVDSSALLARVVSFSQVDERALYDIEAEGSPSKSAAAYFIAARYAYEHGEGEAARKYMKRCIEFEPGQTGLLQWYSVLLLDGGQYQEAVTQAEHAVQRAPNSSEALQVLGLAYYDSGRFAEAIENWKRAQELHPSETITNYLAKAGREAAVEGNFSERESAHFVLRYEGRQTGFHFASELLSTLDRQYGELQRDLGFAPDGTVTVILYTEQQFSEVTQAPSWADGLNDGKVRIPVRDLSGVTPRLEAVLRHEMTHSFIHSLTRGHCPQWLNEGIAQMEEPRSSSAFAAPLAQLFQEGRQAPLHHLEGSFMRLSSAQAQLAYAESLAAAEYLRSTYGMYALRRMLELLNDGEEPEAALSRAVQSNYAEFERGLGSYLAKSAE